MQNKDKVWPSKIISEAYSEANSASSVEPWLKLPDIHDNIARLIRDNNVVLDSDSESAQEDAQEMRKRIKRARAKVFSVGSLQN